MIKVIAVGKKSEYQAQIDDYAKRLKKPFQITWELLNYSKLQGSSARAEESAQILNKLKPSDFVILLDERGEQLNNAELAKTLSEKDVTVIIGGAYGVSEELRGRANLLWSLSALIFPHQLVRLILAEQVYRSQCVVNRHPYHHM